MVPQENEITRDKLDAYLLMTGAILTEDEIRKTLDQCRLLLIDGGVHDPQGIADDLVPSSEKGGRSTCEPDSVIPVAIHNVRAVEEAAKKNVSLPRNEDLDPRNIPGYQGKSQSLAGDSAIRTSTSEAEARERNNNRRYRDR
ncbi:MAG: hypothetical protein PHZ00_07370 [Candidatus Peribacteraceae bacterium]|nr:hypothetical protein [Candidatus Peribacteraceae bacterium]